MSEEAQVLEGLAFVDDHPSEIVNIHFGQKKFVNYQKLIRINEAAKKG